MDNSSIAKQRILIWWFSDNFWTSSYLGYSSGPTTFLYFQFISHITVHFGTSVLYALGYGSFPEDVITGSIITHRRGEYGDVLWLRFTPSAARTEIASICAIIVNNITGRARVYTQRRWDSRLASLHTGKFPIDKCGICILTVPVPQSPREVWSRNPELRPLHSGRQALFLCKVTPRDERQKCASQESVHERIRKSQSYYWYS